MRHKLPNVLSNPVSLTGLIIAVFNIGFIVFLSVVEAFSKRVHPYADLVIWLMLPAFVLFGVALIIIGIRRERRREREGAVIERRFLVLDFNDPRRRKTAILVLTAFLLLSLLYAFAGYKAYEFTESETFCGMMCHQVMGPELRSHAYSVHAEIACVDCHVGPGAKYFLLYKLKGTRQLFDVLAKRYPRPIPTPVADLRPSQDVCEHCHGPKYQINQRLESRTYFLADKKNTRKTISLLLRMGKAEVSTERPPRMHWHSSTTEEIVYAATDPKRMLIPWVRVKRLDGKERVYRSTDSGMTDAELNRVEKRRMDCVDCHNRPGHPYRPPDVIVNALLAAKLIDPALPEVKSVAVKALEGVYASREEARERIGASLREFYKASYPALAASGEAAISRAIQSLQSVYERNYDPHMKVSWKNFPDNQGHRFSPGCFRCHDGKHRSDDGVVLSRDCSLCHLLIERVGDAGAGGQDKASFQVMRNPHPVDIGNSWKEMLCHECHGASP
ncbi:MAG: cytochrome C [Nitrospirae bacterium]|nr:cytochrome C [Nitrospirota bacterium]NTW66376.1 cytochrome C [Nitrospirota bacterium]